MPFIKTKTTAAAERTPTEKGSSLACSSISPVRHRSKLSARKTNASLCFPDVLLTALQSLFPHGVLQGSVFFFTCSDTGLKYCKDLDVSLRTVATLLLKTMEYNHPSSVSHEQHP